MMATPIGFRVSGAFGTKAPIKIPEEVSGKASWPYLRACFARVYYEVGLRSSPTE